MKVLVTGGAGFIGSHIAEKLMQANIEVAIVDNLSTGVRENIPAGVRFYELDVCDRTGLQKAFAEFRPDAICHQAAQMSVSRSVAEPSYDAQVNIMGLLTTLEVSHEMGVKRFVFASSGGVLYGDVTAPVKEDAPANPISPYGISKFTGEHYLKFFTREHGMQTVALRYSNVYGPRQNPHGEAGVVAIFCQRMFRGEGTRINGDGKYIRDYVYVDDVAAANVLVLTQEIPENHIPFNVGTGVSTDVNQLAETLQQQTQEALREQGYSTTVPAPEHGPARPGDLRSNLVDAERLTQTFGWHPQTDLAKGLEQTVRWFANQLQE